MSFLFYLLSAVALLSALMVVFSKNPINSVIFLIICFLAIAGHYILLNAQFLAIVHIIVYTGAILVLFLFVIMLLNLNKSAYRKKHMGTQIAAVISGGLIFLILLASLKETEIIRARFPFSGGIGLVEQIGLVLYRDYLLPFELTSILFISAMVGAVLLARRDVSPKN